MDVTKDSSINPMSLSTRSLIYASNSKGTRQSNTDFTYITQIIFVYMYIQQCFKCVSTWVNVFSI